MTQEITLTLDENLIQQAEMLATKQSLSVRQMLSDLLARTIVLLDDEKKPSRQLTPAQQAARQRSLERMKRGYPLGIAGQKREQFYD